MAVISSKYKFIYALAPRTASTATADHLIKTLDGKWIPGEHILDEKGNIKIDRKHSTFAELIEHEILPKQTVRDFLTFVTVRNPFESLYSAWYKKKFTYTQLLEQKNAFIHKKPGFLEDMMFIRDRSFSEWIVENYLRLAEDSHQRHLNGNYLAYTDRILRFENLNKDFQELLQEFNIPYPGDIPVINKTEGKPTDYKQHYSSEAREIIEKAYCLDLEKFSYQF
ncbi:MAG: sulfotransferase family 2 domain-containing protein [Xenococcaceae cyanobacterium]